MAHEGVHLFILEKYAMDAGKPPEERRPILNTDRSLVGILW